MVADADTAVTDTVIVIGVTVTVTVIDADVEVGCPLCFIFMPLFIMAIIATVCCKRL